MLCFVFSKQTKPTFLFLRIFFSMYFLFIFFATANFWKAGSDNLVLMLNFFISSINRVKGKSFFVFVFNISFFSGNRFIAFYIYKIAVGNDHINYYTFPITKSLPTIYRVGG